ncbi:hypothetical protein HW555_003003 [Spodoptera exigua]|uniref:PHD-type domain-containing protein n=1 Tax=Spodoptera exigua TaxID=7107 RepID=A0A835GNW6_SPOEX|nr:hypothetical protein HW555_003003 [Spodoptera exigua]
MAGKAVNWGCCSDDNDVGGKSIKCPICGKSYHYDCLLLKAPPKDAGAWKCPTCLSDTPKVHRDDSTPVRNISTTRGAKRPAIGSPSPPAVLSDIDELRCVIKQIMQDEFRHMLAKFNAVIVSTINKELEPVKREMQGIIESVSFMNNTFEDLRREHQSSMDTIKNLESKNLELVSTVNALNDRLTNLEQQSRSNNIEVQCVPENKNENIISIVSQLTRVVSCEIKEKDIINCSRVAKLNPSSNRPRSIVVQLASPRIRDQILAATIKYNKLNPQDKLNCSHLGYGGSKSAVYVTEHLSPTNRALHAAARIKAKENGYKYVWVRNGKIFVRKAEGTESIQIKCKNTLSKIV